MIVSGGNDTFTLGGTTVLGELRLCACLPSPSAVLVRPRSPSLDRCRAGNENRYTGTSIGRTWLRCFCALGVPKTIRRSEEHTSELQSLMRISYAVFCLKKKNTIRQRHTYVRKDIH